MRRTLSAFAAALALFLLSGSAAWAAVDQPDVRNVRWGMTKEQVMRAETGKPAFEEEYRLGYIDTVFWNETRIDYTFDGQQKLVDVFLTVRTATPPKTTMIYLKLTTLMQNEYGPPSFIKRDGMEMEFVTKRTAVLLVNDQDNVLVRYTELSSAIPRTHQEDPEPEKRHLSAL